MKPWIIVILLIVLIGVSAQIYLFLKEKNQLSGNLEELNSRLQTLSKENADVKSEIQYLSDPENLGKFLKSRFNYKNPGEKMMIVVP